MKWYQLSPFILQKVIWIPTRLILFFFAHLEVKGLENLKNVSHNVIFAVNHFSEMDAFMVPASLPIWSRFSPIFYATKTKSFYDNSGWRKHLFGGIFINMWGGYTVRSGLHDYEKSLSEHIQILRDGFSFCVFPEGGITKTGYIQKAHGGISYLAEVTGCPVIPVGVIGTYNTTLKDFFLGKKNIIVSFGQPIFMNQVEVKNTGPIANRYQHTAQYVMSKIETIINKEYRTSPDDILDTAPATLS